MKLKIDMLRCFAEVAQHGTLIDAADRLGRTPSAVSMMLKQFEAQLGQPLFATDRKNQLTPLGDFVLEHAQNELRHFDETTRAIMAFATTGGRILRIGAVPSAAGTFLARALGDVLSQTPDIKIELRDHESADVIAGLQDGSLDLGIATVAPQLMKRHRQFLVSDAFGVVCPADHPLMTAKAPLTMDAIRGYPVIANPIAATIRDQAVQDMLADAVMEAHNTISLLAAVRAGVGVTILPRLVVEMSWADLRFVEIDGLDQHRRLDLLYPQTLSITPLQRAVGAKVLAAARAL